MRGLMLSEALVGGVRTSQLASALGTRLSGVPCSAVLGSAGTATFQVPVTTLLAPASQHPFRSSSSSSSGSGGTRLDRTHPPSAAAVSGTAEAAAAATEAVPIADLEAKLALLEGAGIGGADAAQRYAPFLCSPTHHIGVRLAFLATRGKLRHPPRLWQVICPSDAELCQLHGEEPAELAAFKSSHLASPAWRAFCLQHGVRHAGPDQA